MVAAFGGVVPLGGCVALAGGFGGPGMAAGACSLFTSGEAGGAFGGGFTSPSCTCCLGTTGAGEGLGTAGVCVCGESDLGATGSVASAVAEILKAAKNPAIAFFHAIGYAHLQMGFLIRSLLRVLKDMTINPEC